MSTEWIDQHYQDYLWQATSDPKWIAWHALTSRIASDYVRFILFGLGFDPEFHKQLIDQFEKEWNEHE